ncbi:hypothetical protein P691DRAFT_672424 [Macrolepiota fuliginosa MF-IS2]|uniref:DUF4218 domain-containing protein n=1 Tax=Macrolepiota fuliginosa MF-IS2 TaxID=1400762 RepID=A0A9P5XCB8_9AGAR|nr:hypothetical protein P691DRAFT_672424 [Macrolepiota fuliginosa MF-IS2]
MSSDTGQVSDSVKQGCEVAARSQRATRLYTGLSQQYFPNFCKLVHAVRIISQHSITPTELDSAGKLFSEFLIEFEELYVQRITSQMHFVQQCMHVLWHIVPEIYHLGPTCNYAQWTMEQTIGNLGQEIQLHSNPFSNLVQWGILQAQINTLIAKYPELSHEGHVPHDTIQLDGNYALLHIPWDEQIYRLRPDEL